MPTYNLIILTSILAAIFPSISVQTARAEEPPWKGTIPAVYKEASPWAPLLEHLLAHNLNFGALATASRMLTFLPDLNSKTAAYKAAIKVIDNGYPFSTRKLFAPGDIDPSQNDYFFYNSYNLYKAILNKDSGSSRWADNYFSKIDQGSFGKFLFYQSIEAYKKKNLLAAGGFLKKILEKETGDPSHLQFVKKVVRNLARVYFEEGSYEKSLELYSHFLLKLNPISSLDWLEAAWCFYHLKQYPEALGALYNLESAASYSQDGSLDLEKYTIRALIYRQLCASDQAESLIQSFENDFGAVVRGIKQGEALSHYPVLTLISTPESEEYREIDATLKELQLESLRLTELSSEDRKLVNYIYASEIWARKRQLRIYRDQTIELAAKSLISLSEQLKFLKYDVAREKDNPEAVFRSPSSVESKLNHEPPQDNETTYLLHWVQLGDYWWDERNTYRGILENRCLH